MNTGQHIFLGLDLETTGSDLYQGHAICQVGVYLPDREFVSDIGPDPGTPVTEEALNVNGFTMERLAAGPRSRVVDEQLAAWLSQYPAKHIVPIGWNVAGFDMAFVRRYLPLSAKLLSYRSVDLNAICFTLSPKGWDRVKAAAKRYADKQLVAQGWLLKPHDALFDAAHAYYAWEYLRVRVVDRAHL